MHYCVDKLSFEVDCSIRIQCKQENTKHRNKIMDKTHKSQILNKRNKQGILL